MNFKYSYFGLLLAATASISFAQVASHKPTAVKQPPTQKSPATEMRTAPDKPVARVNGAVLTDADLVREEYTIFPYAKQHGGGLPKDLAPQIRDGAMKMIIFEELVYQEALRQKMTVPAAKIQRAEAEFRMQFATPGEFNALFQSEFHGSEDLLKQKIRRSLLIEGVLKSEIESKSAVSLADAKAFYDKNSARFEHPETLAFQTISVLPPPNATADQLKEGRARAEKALHEAKTAKTSEQFGLLAEKMSDDDYRVMMGQHKPVPAKELAPQVLKVLAAMKPGDVSDLIQLEQAYTIVRLQQHNPSGKTKFEQVKAQLLKELRQTKTEQLRTALDKKLRQNAKIDEL